MEYRWIAGLDKFKAISADWDRALIASGEDNPFLLSDFLITWCKHYSQDSKLRVFIVYDQDKIIGGLPLCQKKNGYLEYPGGISANYTEFLSLGDKRVIWEHFFNSLYQLEAWRCLRLRRIRQSRFNISQLKEISFHCKDILMDLHRSEYSYLIKIPENFSEYIQHLPKKLRYYVLRSEREFSRIGIASLVSFKSETAIKRLADIYINFSRASFKARNKRSAFEDKTYCDFFKETISKMHKAGYLDANALSLEGKFIAAHFGYSIGNNLNYIFPAFDIGFADLNPGHLLIYKLIELGVKRKNKIFDLYTGYSFYKEQWCDHKEEVFSLDIRPNRLRGKVERAIARQIRASKIINKSREFIKGHGALMPLAKRVAKLIRN